MKIIRQCIRCLLDDILEAIDLLGADEQSAETIIQECLSYIDKHYNDKAPPSYYITALHRIVKQHLGLSMPFKKLRLQCLRASLAIAKKTEKYACKLKGYNRFRYLALWAIASNSLDFRTIGAGYRLNVGRIESALREKTKQKLAIDNLYELYKLCLQARSIVYIPDNVGELPFDRLLIQQMSSFGAEVTVPFRDGPITSDATKEDGKRAGIYKVAHSVISSGPDTLGIDLDQMSPECRDALSKAELIVAKGQANFYVFSEFKNLFSHACIGLLFTTKCDFVSKILGTEAKSSIALILKDCGCGSRRL